MIKDECKVVNRTLGTLLPQPAQPRGAEPEPADGAAPSEPEDQVNLLQLFTLPINALGTMAPDSGLDQLGTPQQPRRLRWDFAGGLQRS